jgi:hypothetical protein
VVTARRPRGGVLPVAARFVTGLPLDGIRRTDATFWQRGTITTEPHWWGRSAASWSMLAGWQRATVRLCVVGLAVGLMHWRRDTEWAAAAILGPGLGVLAVRAVRAVQLGHHRRKVLRPLAAALAPALETSAVEVERSLTVPRGKAIEDRQARVSALLPKHHQGSVQQTDAIARIVGQRVGGEWQARIQREPLAMVITRRPEPPRRVNFCDVADLIADQGSLYRPLMGIGSDHDPVWLDFGAEIAHQGMSVGTGGGKSAYLRYLVAQFAYHGCADFPVIDSKFVSLDGMEAVPGLRVYRDTAEQWAALAGLRDDMDQRYARLLADRGTTFPLTVLLLEEQNDAAIEWRAFWRQLRETSGELPGKPGRFANPRDAATPPVYDDLTRLLIKGRQVGYRVVGVYQRLSAAACGGIDAGVMRDAYGQKALARFGPQAWDALTGIRPRAASSAIPGRWVSVLGHDVRAVQVPYGEPDELVAFALSAPAPGAPVPGACASSPQASVIVPAATAAPPGAFDGLVVGLDAAAEALAMTYHGFRKARQRRPIDGELTSDGRPAWPVEALAAWRGGAS